jgi:glycosyltransferase involved in cell wall biosynthesis
MSPAGRRGTPNRYIEVTVDGLRAAGVEVCGLPFLPARAPGSTVHLHWPEMYFSSGFVSRNLLLNAARIASILATIRRVKRAGGRLVWTVHNLAPHGRLPPALEAAYERFHTQIIKDLDVFVSLTEAGVAEIRRAFPRLASVPYVVARHPHYRGVVPRATVAAEIRRGWNLGEDAIVLGVLGQILPHKHVGGVLRAFRGIADPRLRLVVAGPCRDENRIEILVHAAADSRILFFEQDGMSDQTLADYHGAVDMIVYNGVRNFNSGTVIMALSLNRPLIAPASPVNAEIADIVGADWMTLFEPPLTSAALREAVARLHARTRDDQCPLDAFDPLLSGRILTRAYRAPADELVAEAGRTAYAFGAVE